MPPLVPRKAAPAGAARPSVSTRAVNGSRRERTAVGNTPAGRKERERTRILADHHDGARSVSRRWLSIPDPLRTICPKCGSTEREGEDFCVCGEYLGWDDPEAPSDEAHASEAPEPP